MESSGIAIIGIGIELPKGFGSGVGIGVDLPLWELEFTCKNGIYPSSDHFTFQPADTARTNVYNALDREGVAYKGGNSENMRKFPFSRQETVTTTGK